MNIKKLPCHVDDRGQIQMIIEDYNIKSISRIESYPNTWRARHAHEEIHYCEVIEGQVEYYETWLENGKPLRKPLKQLLNKGDIFVNIPNYFHEMVFNCYTIFNCYATKPRNQDSYEKDLIRFPELSLKELYDNWPNEEKVCNCNCV